jgi:hypothetical protein
MTRRGSGVRIPHGPPMRPHTPRVRAHTSCWRRCPVVRSLGAVLTPSARRGGTGVPHTRWSATCRDPSRGFDSRRVARPVCRSNRRRHTAGGCSSTRCSDMLDARSAWGQSEGPTCTDAYRASSTGTLRAPHRPPPDDDDQQPSASWSRRAHMRGPRTARSSGTEANVLFQRRHLDARGQGGRSDQCESDELTMIWPPAGFW